ncbi:uncharacterized protein LOC133716763 [Rosa rugosa]|uniref:uncharacterized protein LOC133716763 n=1 Tax=Rosa rugosa TaxID=74645 RepID=UPI002B40B1DC|nr:uncharacterized protein LOC133716763 [Rosa rugosa]
MAMEQENKTCQDELLALRDSRGKGKEIVESSERKNNQDGSWKRRMTNQQAPAKEAAAPVRQVAPLRCFNCNEMGYTAKGCTKPKNVICLKCGQAGHYSRDCTQAQGGGQGNQQRQLPQEKARVFAVVQQGAREEGTLSNSAFVVRMTCDSRVLLSVCCVGFCLLSTVRLLSVTCCVIHPSLLW